MKQYFLAAIIFCSFAGAIVLHTNNEPPADWTGRPSSNVVGRWASNASCVVVSAHCVITTNHQYGGYGSIITIDGVSYKAIKEIRHSDGDVRVVRLRYATLADYVAINTSSSDTRKSVVCGGYGKYRGSELVNGSTVYGYNWAGTNSTIHWGTNDTERTVTENGSIDLLSLDFDGPGSTEYECVIAEYDSGGGVFYDNGSEWVLLGLNYGIVNPYGDIAYFKNPSNPIIPEPQGFSIHRAKDFASWANSTIAELDKCGSTSADIDEDCKVNTADIIELALSWTTALPTGNAKNADTNSDNVVDLLDFINIAKNWKIDYY